MIKHKANRLVFFVPNTELFLAKFYNIIYFDEIRLQNIAVAFSISVLYKSLFKCYNCKVFT